MIRAISVLEGIALVGNPQFAIVDEAYPYISRRLLTDRSPRLRAALKYMVYGQSGVFDVERVIDLLQALEKFLAVRDSGDGTAFKVDGVRGGQHLGSAGSFAGTRALEAMPAARSAPRQRQPEVDTAATREALAFFFSDDGEVFREFLLDEVTTSVDALNREALSQIAFTVGLQGASLPPLVRALAPPLSDSDRRVVENISRLIQFLLGNYNSANPTFGSAADRAMQARQLQALIPVLSDYSEPMRRFGLQIFTALAEKQTGRAFAWAKEQLGDASYSATPLGQASGRL